ncbi:MAG: hypothetical protein ABIK99_06670 [candidate division WOR-3 bacterium]
MVKRGIGFIILLIITGGILGSAFSQYLSTLFPPGPVRDFFFKAIRFGLENLNLNLGFLHLAFGFTFNITAFTALFVFFLLYLNIKL